MSKLVFSALALLAFSGPAFSDNSLVEEGARLMHRYTDVFNQWQQPVEGPGVPRRPFLTRLTFLSHDQKIFLIKKSHALLEASAATGAFAADNLIHTMEHRADAEKFARINHAALGLDDEGLDTLVLLYLHDLGKSAMPPVLAAYFDSLWHAPTPFAHFVERRVMSHEFGSFWHIEVYGKELGLDPAAISLLQRVILRHNFGPLFGMEHHWWPKRWRETFAPVLKRAGIPIDENYASADPRGPLALYLTLTDRKTALTDMSALKFTNQNLMEGSPLPPPLSRSR